VLSPTTYSYLESLSAYTW